MNSKLLFLFGCMPARLLIALLAYKININYLPYISLIFIAIGASFIYLYLTNSRLKAAEAGGETWWKNLRPIHGVMYILAGIYALKKSRISALILLIDVLFGFGAFVYHHSLDR